jgi:two-component system, OmpR family, phosphate regulon sensor histidine kinase PhoR
MAFDVLAGSVGALAGIIGTYVALRPRGARARQTPATPPAEPPRAALDERAARLIAALPFAAFIVDERARVRMFNNAAAVLFTVDPDWAIGRAIIEVVPSVDLERMVGHALAGETRTGDIVFGSGTRERFVGVTAQPYEHGAMAIAADRTSSLSAERMRADFVGNVSHELRTPLTAMKVMLDTVMVSDDDAEARELFLPQIEAELERMIRLVEDLLELARSESGTIRLRRERFDLGDVASATVNTFARRADSAGIELELDAPEAVAVDADRGRLVQIALNLLDNAVRHTPRGGRIVVEVRRDGPSALLAVRDNGAGIPFADLPRVFERFYVVDRSRSREHGGGTGLGLAIAKHLAESHGGSLTAASVYGHGATFTLRIPVADEQALRSS